MFTKRHDYTLKQVNEKLVLRSWGASVGVLPLANRLVVLLCNYTELTPNQITAISSVFRVLSVLCFLTASRVGLVVGALCYYLAYVIDCIDGPVARLKGLTSDFGRYFDHLSDLVGDFLILAALAAGQGFLDNPLVIGMLFMHIAESYISYLTNIGLKGREESASRFFDGKGGLISAFFNYREFFFRKNLKSFISFPDYALSTFVFFPLFGHPIMGLFVGFGVLLVATLYTILSTFVTLHSSASKFP